MSFALLIGINYENTPHQLNGCINDITNVKRMLINKYGFIEDNIIFMSDKMDGDMMPTKNNIIKQINNLVEKKPNRVWFHYSGHGTQVMDVDGDEVDGLDEVLVPVDFMNGFITDDELLILFKKFDSGCKVFCVFDCCHSGSILDLPYRYDNENLHMENDKRIDNNIIMLSGCKDKQTSADATFKNISFGALTNSMLSVLRYKKYNVGFIELVKLINILLRKEYTQKSQLSSSREIDVDNMFSSFFPVSKNIDIRDDDIEELTQMFAELHI